MYVVPSLPSIADDEYIIILKLLEDLEEFILKMKPGLSTVYQSGQPS